jgi:hypothetical protein
MSNDSKRFRNNASDELRLNRKIGSSGIKADHVKRAASYKALADNEEWLEGDKSRSKLRPAKRRYRVDAHQLAHSAAAYDPFRCHPPRRAHAPHANPDQRRGGPNTVSLPGAKPSLDAQSLLNPNDRHCRPFQPA